MAGFRAKATFDTQAACESKITRTGRLTMCSRGRARDWIRRRRSYLIIQVEHQLGLELVVHLLVVEQVDVEVFVHEQQQNDFDELDVLGQVDVHSYLHLAGPEQSASRERTRRARMQLQGAHLADSPFLPWYLFFSLEMYKVYVKWMPLFALT